MHEAPVRDLMQRFLAKEGFRVATAAGGDEGLRQARELHPDAITLDVMMPGMDGWAVLSALKADPATADIPVIMLTIVDDKNLGYALGAADYLTKPVDRERLNVTGSSLATGHPFAATGARIVATLAKLLAERGAPGRGLISICAAGGQGVTAILERT